MAIVDKIKSDIKFRNKVIGGAVVFILAMFLGIIGVLSMESKEESEEARSQEDKIAQEMAKGVVPTDTTLVVPNKRAIYEQMDYFQSEENKEIRVVTDESIIGKTPEEIAQKHNQEDDEISSYMRKRREKMATTSSEEEPTYRSTGISNSSTSSTRRYNPYANSQDWVDVSTDIENHKTGREKQQEQQQEQSQPKKSVRKGKAKSFEELSAIEQRRILLETGQSYYQETSEFSAMIMSSGMVKSGEVITIITKEDAYINFEKIPRGTTMAGVVSFGENRLQVNFSTIRLKKKILKVDLTLYGLDGLAGLPVDIDMLNKDIQDAGEDGVTEAVNTTRLGRITTALYRGAKGRKEQKVDLGRDIMCILVNNNAE